MCRMRTTALGRLVMVLVLPLVLGCSGAWSVRTEGENRAQGQAGVVPLKTASEEPTATFQSDGPVYSLAISPGGRFVALGGTGRIEVWDVLRSIKLQSLATRSRDVVALAFGPKNDVLASGGYRAIELWDIDRGQRRASFATQSGYVSSLAFSPDGALLASGSQGGDGEIHIWGSRGPSTPASVELFIRVCRQHPSPCI